MGGRFLGLLAGLALTVGVLAAPARGATIKVDTTNDELANDGDCSLREAVQSANTNSSVDDCQRGQGGKRDTVKLKAEGYELDLASSHEDLNANGDLDLGDPDPGDDPGPISLAGEGRIATTVSTDLDDRVLDIHRGKATIGALGIEDGNVLGLGSGNNLGGGVKSTFARLTVRGVRIAGGEAGFGGGLSVGGGRLLLTRTVAESNFAQEGGAIYLSGEPTATISRSELASNDAERQGGAVASKGLSLRVLDTEMSGNGVISSDEAALGGAIFSEGNLEIRRSLFAGNGVLADTNGQSESGGAVFARGEFGELDIAIANSTFTENTAADTEGTGGAIFLSDGEASVAHSTFLANDADAGDHVAAAGPPFLTLRNSILPGVSIVVDVCSGSVISKGFNVANYDDADCAFLDSDVFGAPGLVPGGPADNGGPTETIEITGSSLAKDLVPRGKCKVAQGEDQRGFERPKGPRCDAGAFERGAQPSHNLLQPPHGRT